MYVLSSQFCDPYRRVHVCTLALVSLLAFLGVTWFGSDIGQCMISHLLSSTPQEVCLGAAFGISLYLFYKLQFC